MKRGQMTDEEIHEFMGKLDDLTLAEFNDAFKGIYFELNERIRYQAHKHDIDIHDIAFSYHRLDEVRFMLEHGF